MINRVSKQLASRLALATEYSEYEDYFRYGFELLIGYTIKVILLIIVSIYLNILIPTLLLVLSFVTIRVFSGGKHLSTYLSCLIFSLCSFWLFSWFAIESALLINFNLILFHAIFLGGFLICNFYITNEKNFRKKSLKVLTFWYFVLLGLYFIDFNDTYMFALLYGLVLQLVSITPAGTKVISLLDKLLLERRWAK